MTAKRFKLEDIGFVYDNGALIVMKEIVECLNNLHEEKEYWKKRALLLENKYNEEDSIEWLRNNTVWEQMPTNRKTYTRTDMK